MSASDSSYAVPRPQANLTLRFHIRRRDTIRMKLGFGLMWLGALIGGFHGVDVVEAETEVEPPDAKP